MGWRILVKKRIFGVVDRRAQEVVWMNNQTVDELRQLVIDLSAQLARHERSAEEVITKLETRIAFLEKN
jgi:hypothetical protein